MSHDKQGSRIPSRLAFQKTACTGILFQYSILICKQNKFGNLNINTNLCIYNINCILYIIIEQETIKH